MLRNLGTQAFFLFYLNQCFGLWRNVLYGLNCTMQLQIRIEQTSVVSIRESSACLISKIASSNRFKKCTCMSKRQAQIKSYPTSTAFLAYLFIWKYLARKQQNGTNRQCCHFSCSLSRAVLFFHRLLILKICHICHFSWFYLFWCYAVLPTKLCKCLPKKKIWIPSICKCMLLDG